MTFSGGAVLRLFGSAAVNRGMGALQDASESGRIGQSLGQGNLSRGCGRQCWVHAHGFHLQAYFLSCQLGFHQCDLGAALCLVKQCGRGHHSSAQCDRCADDGGRQHAAYRRTIFHTVYPLARVSLSKMRLRACNFCAPTHRQSFTPGFILSPAVTTPPTTDPIPMPSAIEFTASIALH